MLWILLVVGGIVIAILTIAEIVSRRSDASVTERMKRRRDLKDDPHAHQHGSW